MAAAIEQRLSDPKLRSIFEYFIKYVGSSALAAPGYMNMMPIIQFDYGLWYVRGGMYQLAQGLEKLMGQMGISVHRNTDVVEISTRGDVAKGIVLATGEQIPADLVLSNMEVIPTYEKLLERGPPLVKKFAKFQPACSGLVIHLGTDRVFPQLAHHNFFYSENQHKHFRSVFEEKKIPDDPTLYVVAPCKTDPSKAPEGCENIKILPHIPHLAGLNDSEQLQHEYAALRERVLDKLERMGLKGLRASIVTEDILTPVDIERMYRSNQGSIYGVESNWRLNYGFKAPKSSKYIHNLYFCDGSVNPGGGMPMVVLCGQKVADRIIASCS